MERRLATQGIITGLSRNLEWLLPWWWEHYTAHNSYPVLFADFGLSETAKTFCKERGTLLSIDDFPFEKEPSPSTRQAWEKDYGKTIWESRPVWFKKPLALISSPFEKTLWLDIDCKVQGSLAPLFKTLGKEIDIALLHCLKDSPFLAKGILRYNSGAIAFKKNALIIHQWIQTALEEQDHLPGDEECLSFAIHKNHPKLKELPPLFNWLCIQGKNPKALIYHCCQEQGRAEVLAEIIRKSGQSPLEKGIVIGVPQDLEWLLPWWWTHYQAHNSYPVAFADLGMSDEARRFCKTKGLLLPARALEIPPFQKTLSIDIHCTVEGALEPLFNGKKKQQILSNYSSAKSKLKIIEELLQRGAKELLESVDGF